jgi:hypothetical protein
MSRLALRIARKLDLFGEEVAINGTTHIKAFVQVLDTGRMHAYLDDTEAAVMVRPGLLLITSDDAALAVNDTLTRDGRTFTVRKVSTERALGEMVVKIAVLS